MVLIQLNISVPFVECLVMEAHILIPSTYGMSFKVELEAQLLETSTHDIHVHVGRYVIVSSQLLSRISIIVPINLSRDILVYVKNYQ